MTELDEDIRTFLAAIDLLAERLDPPRRAQDKATPECSPRELRVLGMLGRHGRLSMSELAGNIEVPLSTATRTVEKLVGKGLVERTQSARDGRIVEISFSTLGKQINRYIDRTRQTQARSMLSGLSDNERKRFLRRLARLPGSAGTAHNRRQKTASSRNKEK